MFELKRLSWDALDPTRDRPSQDRLLNHPFLALGSLGDRHTLPECAVSRTAREANERLARRDRQERSTTLTRDASGSVCWWPSLCLVATRRTY